MFTGTVDTGGIPVDLHVWEPLQANASTAIKGDYADLSLWGFAGDSIDLEQSCKKISDLLFIQWVNLLKREELAWFYVQDSKTQDKDQSDICEYVTRMANSNWW